MNTKTVKEKVAEIIYKGIPFVCSEEIYHEVATKIDKLYRKEMIKIVEGNKLPDPNPYGEYVKIKNVNLILDKVKWECEVKYHALPERRKIKSTYEENKMPETLLDDDIADWEHDNLVDNN